MATSFAELKVIILCSISIFYASFSTINIVFIYKIELIFYNWRCEEKPNGLENYEGKQIFKHITDSMAITFFLVSIGMGHVFKFFFIYF